MSRSAALALLLSACTYRWGYPEPDAGLEEDADPDTMDAMILDAREGRSKRVIRIAVINTKTGRQVQKAVAIDTDERVITVKMLPDFIKGAERMGERSFRYEEGDYIFRDTKHGYEWPTADAIPCVKDKHPGDCLCFSCLKE